jgi:hypothetical protein
MVNLSVVSGNKVLNARAWAARPGLTPYGLEFAAGVLEAAGLKPQHLRP